MAAGVAIATAAAAAMPGCGREHPGIELVTCEAGVTPGDLVITELMANPAGDDEGSEWFEFYNATDHDVDLTGVVLALSKEDGRNPKTHTMHAAGTGGSMASMTSMASMILGPGEYLVAGGILPEFLPAHVHYGYASDLGIMNNTAGRLAIQCDGVEIDGAIYADIDSGVAQALSATLAPDHTANDDLANWCQSTAEYAPESFGTPGEANDCLAGPSDGMCRDGDTRRPVVTPTPGVLVIAELMANPAAVSDTDGEWFELYATAAVDLNDLTVGRDAAEGPDVTVAASDCLPVAAGGRVVFAKTTDLGRNGDLPQVDHTFRFSLVNSSGTLYIGHGDAVLDQITWSSSQSGASTALDPGALTPEDNDDEERWCPGTAPYGAGDLGTPGSANAACGVDTSGMCDDRGTLRPIVSPTAGQAVITEYMPNPGAVSDATGEWLEVRFDADIDLNGLQLGRTVGTVDTTIESPTCLRVTAGTHALFARSDVAADNGGLPPPDGLFEFSLVNADGSVFVGVADTVLDSVDYATSTAGSSTSLDEADGVTWCANSTDVYGAGDTGTPRASNPACP